MNCRIACCGEHIALKTRGILRDCKIMLAGKLRASISQAIHKIYANHVGKTKRYSQIENLKSMLFL